MKTLDQATSRELEIEQVRRRVSEVDAEIKRITCEVLPGMIQKQERRRKELERQETLARCSNDELSEPPVKPTENQKSEARTERRNGGSLQ